MVRCLVVDDEPLAQKVLERHIGQLENLALVKCCAHAMEAFEAISSTSIDLMFLDIKMPSISGIDFIKNLKNAPPVIFTTAFSEFAVRSYELEAVDYLLKPITFDRFEKSINKFLKLTTQIETAPAFTYFKVDGRLVRIEHETLVYAQSIRDYVIIHTTRGNYITHMTMKYLAGLLPENAFIRVHRSYLIGVAHITGLDNNQALLGEACIPIGESFRKEVFMLRSRMIKS